MAFYNNVIAGAAGAGGAAGYKIERSLRFNDDDSAYLQRVFAKSHQKTFTWSGWVKRNSFGTRQILFGNSETTNKEHYINFEPDNKLLYVDWDYGSYARIKTSQVFRDPSAWYHIVVAVDTTIASPSSDRVKMYVNGVRVTQFDDTTYPAQNRAGNLNHSVNNHRIGRASNAAPYPGDFQLTEIYFVDGQALAPDGVFGEFDTDTGVWSPIEYTRTGPNDGSTYISSSTLNSGNRGAGAGDSAMFSGTVPASYSVGGSFGGTAVDPSTTSSSLTINLSKSVSGRVSIYPYYAASAANCSVVFSNGNTVNLSGAELYFGAVDLGVQSSFNSITFNQGFITGGGSNFGIGGIAIDGVLLRDSSTVNTGLNDFHLKFDDNSSDAALGTDSSGNNNTWTVNNFLAQGNAGDPFTVYGNATNSGSSNPESVGNLSTLQSTSTTSYSTGSTAYNHLTADFGSVGNWKINADPFLSASTANITVYQSNNGTSWTSISIGQSPYSFSGRYIQWVRSGSGYGDQTLTAADTRPDEDSLLDSPTNYEASSGNNGGNYCTLNPLDRDRNGKVTLSNGNLEATGTSNQYGFVRGTLAPASGKFYYEVTTNGAQGGGYGLVEATAPDQVSGSNPDYTIASAYRNYAYFYTSGFQVYIDNNLAYTGSAVNSGDVVGVAVDVDAGKVWFSHNGVWQGSGTQNPATGAGGYSPTNLKTACPYFQDGAGSPVPTGKFNFGQRSFKYTPPTNFKSFCTQNLDDPLIADGSAHFDTKLYTGNGGYQIVGGGIRYSDYVTGDIDSSFPAYRAFRNKTDQVGVRTQTAGGATIVWQPPSPIAFTSSFKIWAARDGTHAGTSFTVTHAGGDTNFTSSVATGTTQTAVDLAQISGVTSPITKITVVSGGPNPRFSGIEVDGSMLIDSTADPYNFSPDLVWTKCRSVAHWHILGDTIRGAGPTLTSNVNYLEWNDGLYSSFDSDGFTVAQVSSNQSTNGNNQTHVGWAWDGGDLATNSAYNQSQNWTSLLTSSAGTISNPGNSFDGSTSTTSQLPSTSAGSYIQLGATLTGVTKLEVYQRSASDVSGTGIQTYNNCPAVQWVQLTLTSSTISNIRFEKNTNDPGIYAIRVNDKILVDPGVIPVGSLNSSAYNDGEVWSSTGTLVVDLNGSTVTNMTGALSKAFNGSTADSEQVTEGSSYSSGTKTYTYTFGTAQTNVTSARVYCYKGNSAEGGTVSFGNGTVNKPADSAYGWIDATSTIPSNGTISALTFTTTATSSIGSARNGFHAIELNGKILLDNGVTAVDNFPSIPSTVRANQTAGFSIVSFTGTGAAQTTAHGLNATPGLVLLKNRTSNNTHWQVFGDDYERLQLSTTQSALTGNYTLERTSTTISPTQNSVSELQINQNGHNFIAYCFVPVEGYSAFGKYTGNGLTNGPFVYTGFRPAFIIVKRISGTARNWVMIDTTRSSFNEADEGLYPNLDSVEDTGTDWADILSNGFKTRNNNASWNTSGAEYIYLCWAENPLKYARAR